MTSTDLFDVAGSHVLVTGGTSGIGLMIARGFLEAGARVVISSRKEQAVRLAEEDLRVYGDVVGIAGDVSRPESARALAERVSEHFPRLDVLVNNAGVTWGAPLEEFPDEAWKKVFGTNLEGVFHLTVAALPTLRQAVSDRGRATIINIGSTDGINVPRLDNFAYGASKAAVHHLTRHLARKLAADAITVNAISPGPFVSRMTKFVVEDPVALEKVVGDIPLGRLGEPDDVVGLSIYLASRAGRYLTGTVIPLDGGGVGCGAPIDD